MTIEAARAVEQALLTPHERYGAHYFSCPRCQDYSQRRHCAEGLRLYYTLMLVHRARTESLISSL